MIVDSECTSGCATISNTFDPNSSSSFQNESTPFEISFGSGHASGWLGKDIVEMAGFIVSNQIFAVCDLISPGLFANPVSGLLGLAFDTIAASKEKPFWQTLVENGAWDAPLMSFHLTRLVVFSIYFMRLGKVFVFCFGCDLLPPPPFFLKNIQLYQCHVHQIRRTWRFILYG